MFLNICAMCSVGIDSVSVFPLGFLFMGKNWVRLGSIQQEATEFRDLLAQKDFVSKFYRTLD